MNRAERIYRIHGLISQRPRSLAELQTGLMGASRATVVRDIGYLRDFMEAPIRYDRAANTYGYDPKASCFELPGFWLNESELSGLLATEQLLEQMQPDLLKPYIGPLKGRIRRLLAESGHSAAAVAERILFRTTAHRRGDPQRFGTVATAVLQAHKLHIRYHGRHSDRETQRDIHPQRLLRYKDNWHLIAHCDQADALRNFSLDRILAADPIDTPARPTDPKVIDRFLGASFGIFSGVAKAWAILRFTPHAARWVADETWHPDQLGQWTDGTYELQVPYSDPRELIRDILAYGPDVQVIGPPELQDMVAERLRQAADQYNDR
jgi:predicted DNA-binding transcriptional regulator YafY